MTIKQLLACEARQLRREYLLPNSYKHAGLGLLVAAVIAAIFITLMDLDTWKSLSMKGVLVGMLIIAISRDKEEDELTRHLRMQSFTLALILGVIYALLQPYINYGIGLLIKPESTSFSDLPGSIIVWFMLWVQIGFYHLLKWTR